MIKIEQVAPAKHVETAESGDMAVCCEDAAPLSTTKVNILEDEPTTTYKLYVPDIVGTYDACAKLGSTREIFALNEKEDDDAI